LAGDERLDLEQQRALAARIQAGNKARAEIDNYQEGFGKFEHNQAIAEDGLKARNELVTAFLPMATWFVRQTVGAEGDFSNKNSARGPSTRLVSSPRVFRSGTDLDFADRVQIANETLLKAADSYDGRARFSTWGYRALEWRFIKASRQVESPISIGPNKVYEVRSVERSKAELEYTLERSPTYDELSEATHFEPIQIVEYARMRSLMQRTSYEALKDYYNNKQAALADQQANHEPDDDYPEFVEDVLADHSQGGSVADQATDFIVRATVDMALADLSEKERDVLEPRFGLGLWDGQEHTLERIGQSIGLTREGVRQVELKAMIKLRIPHDGTNSLESVLDNIGNEDPSFGVPEYLKFSKDDDDALGLHRPPAYSFSPWNEKAH
jgi:RNA polymerase primary sigma factor